MWRNVICETSRLAARSIGVGKGKSHTHESGEERIIIMMDLVLYDAVTGVTMVFLVWRNAFHTQVELHIKGKEENMKGIKLSQLFPVSEVTR